MNTSFVTPLSFNSFRFSLCIGLFFLLSLSNIYAQNTVFIQENEKKTVYPLGHLVEILEDKTHKLTLKDVLSKEYHHQFKLSTQKHPNQGYSSSDFWFRIKVNKPKENTDTWLLHFYSPNIDTLDVNFVDENLKLIKHYRGGDAYGFYERPILYFQFLYPFPKQENFYIYIKFSGYYAKKHDLCFKQDIEILQEAQYYLGRIIFTSAIIFGLAIYNLLLYLSIRDKSYFYYVVYLFAIFGYIIGVNGLAFQFLYPNIPIIAGFFVNFCAILACVSALQFGNHFLKVKTLFPKIYTIIFQIYYYLGILVIILLPFFVYVFTNLLSSYINFLALYVFVSFTFTVFLGVYGTYKRYRPAFFFFGAWILLILSALTYVMQLFGFPISSNLSDIILSFGVIGEAFILSFGLSDKIKTTEREKRNAQKENVRLITEQKEVLEQKVTERTQALAESVEELNQTNEELSITLEVVNHQKEEIEYINKNLTDSIHYAQRIQLSMLPHKEEIAKILPSNFIFFQPKDIVSGDFYYIEQKNDKIIAAAIDCTGHGVPGALMTMLANEVLNQIILNEGVLSPDQILNELHKNIRKTLKQAESNNRDGMDLVLLVIDKKEKKATFAGAKNSLVYIQNDTIHQIKGDKMPIGGEQKEEERIFTSHEINIDIPTTFYLFTDGFQDQFGGKEGKKFLSTKLRELLGKLAFQDLEIQQQTLKNTFEDWINEGNEKQIDDVLVIGLEIN